MAVVFPLLVAAVFGYTTNGFQFVARNFLDLQVVRGCKYVENQSYTYIRFETWHEHMAVSARDKIYLRAYHGNLRKTLFEN